MTDHTRAPDDPALPWHIRPETDGEYIHDADGRLVGRISASHPQWRRNIRLVAWAVNQLAGTRQARLRQAVTEGVGKFDDEEVTGPSACWHCDAVIDQGAHRAGCPGT